MPQPTRVKYLSWLYSRVHYIRQGQKGLTGTNTLAYYEHSLIMVARTFITLDSGHVSRLGRKRK